MGNFVSYLVSNQIQDMLLQNVDKAEPEGSHLHSPLSFSPEGGH
jgi:hypothetical protein